MEPIQYKESSQAASSMVSAGTVIADRYQIIQTLGTGGMGTVYLATDSFLGDEPVAIKILHPDYVKNTTQTSRFLREVQLMRRVSQRNVVRTYDVGTAGNLIFFTMEFVNGVSFEKKMDEAPFSNERIIDFVLQLCDALQTIHEADIIHRDLKPGNILLLEEGTIKLTDFGVARPQRSSLTSHDEIVGSVCYIAPELWLGEPATAAVDLYAFGVIIYEMCTGEVPFDGDSPIALMRLHLDKAPTPPIELNPHIPPWLNQVILKLLEKKPEDRPRSAEQISSFINLHLRKHNDSATGIAVPEARLESAQETAIKQEIATPTISKRLVSKKTESEGAKDDGVQWRVARLSLILAISSILLSISEIQQLLAKAVSMFGGKLGEVGVIAFKALLLPSPPTIYAVTHGNIEVFLVAAVTALYILYLCKEMKRSFYKSNPFSRRAHRMIPVILGIAWMAEAIVFAKLTSLTPENLLYIGGAINYLLLGILFVWGSKQRPDLKR